MIYFWENLDQNILSYVIFYCSEGFITDNPLSRLLADIFINNIKKKFVAVT